MLPPDADDVLPSGSERSLVALRIAVAGRAGKCAVAEHAGPFPGMYSAKVLQSDKHHMTGKPTALMRELVRIVRPGGVILDCFMGSGTTGVAAVLEGRKFIGIETDPEHFKTACRRIQQAHDEVAA